VERKQHVEHRFGRNRRRSEGHRPGRRKLTEGPGGIGHPDREGRGAELRRLHQGEGQREGRRKKDTATQTLGDFASAIRKAGDDLAQNDQSLAGKVVKQAADGLESFTRSIGDKRPEDLLNAVRDFGRNNPAAFIAGSVLLGIALGRLAKSTEQRGADGGGTSSFRSPGDARIDGGSGSSPTAFESYPTTGAAIGSPYGSGV
jgi:hypothetical protein